MEVSLILFQKLGIALLLGLLVGLQREQAANPLAGMRTFPLITILGSVAALVDQQMGLHGVIVATGFVALAIVVGVGKYFEMQRVLDADTGITTEVAILLMYGVGAYLILGEQTVAVAIGVAAAILLHFKPELHGIAQNLGKDDFKAILQFALITFIVLPILPNQTYGPFDVLNPFEIWMMVILIVGISLAGYIIYKFFGDRAGTLLGGILGGSISSTATTVSYSRLSVEAPERAKLDAMVIVIASTVVYVRVIVEISVISREFLSIALGPVLVMLAVTALTIMVLWWRIPQRIESMPEQKNPTQMQSALVFAMLYGLVLLGLAAAKSYLGGEGLYLVAFLSGLTDMDAITLSTSRMVEAGFAGNPAGVDPQTGWRIILVAAISNLLFKAALVGALGDRRLLWWILFLFAVPAIAGGIVIGVWPADYAIPVQGLL